MTQILGGDLYHLWRVSDVHLPRIADVFSRAIDAIAGVPAGDAIFRADASIYIGGPTHSSVGEAWDDLRAELEQLLKDAILSIDCAEYGLRKAQQAYVDADLASADALSKYLADPINHDPLDPASNPPPRGSVEDPGYIPLLP